MTAFQAIILGIVQGLAEFLPISSSGHLVFFQKAFGLEENLLVFDTMLHVGTLVAVFFVFWKDIVDMLKRPFSKFPLLLVVATLPTVVIAVLLEDFIEEAFIGAAYLGIGFLITGVALFLVESIDQGHKKLKEMSFTDAVVVGIVQGMAIFPGISRSGSTIAGALFRKVDRNFAARFSLLLSIPAILGSVVFQAKDILEVGGQNESLAPIILGTIAAAVSGFFAIKILIRALTRGSLKKFAYYVFALGVLVLLDQYIFHFIF